MDGQGWSIVKERLRAQVTAEDFENWLEPLEVESSNTDSSAVTLSVPSKFFVDYLQRHYTDLIQSHLRETLNNEAASVGYVVRAPFQNAPKADSSASPVAATELPAANGAQVTDASGDTLMQGGRLNPAYRFDTFVTGKSNSFAFAAAQRIAESDDTVYNPFFLHGGVGLGKTHLMHAIGNYITEQFPDRQVLYISAEQFLYRFIRALRDRKTVQFKEAFRSVDVLMIDDIQFIAGKESTQEEFFHTFNALVELGKQIVLTADRSPHELANIEDRLRSRLACGLTTEIHSPDLETRLAILQKKAVHLGMNLPDDVANLLAERITSNVRELEGALNRLAAHSNLTGQPISIEGAHQQLADMFRASWKVIQIEDIQKAVTEHYRLRMTDLLAARRSRHIARPRQVAMYLCKQLTSKSFPDIGKAFGGRDHTTVIHAVRTIEKMMSTDPSIAEDVTLLEQRLQG